MCLEDVKIGKASQGKMIPFTITAAGAQVLPQDNNRRGIILGPPDAGTVTYFQGQQGTAGLGFNLTSQSGVIELDADLWGSVVRDPWFAIANPGPSNIAVAFVHFQREDMQ